ncbi:MAG TPA: PadR family transcriptional regulator [Bryobacteraceae bacterium]|nr:PadR family transcriptional regulator [Bryobacteraceae bacterium]
MPAQLSLTSAIILLAIENGRRYGFEIMEATGLASGTIYPALRRLENSKLIRSDWEAAQAAPSQGPPRKYFRLTPAGKTALLAAGKRFPVVAQWKG